MNLQKAEVTQLLGISQATSKGVTGSWIDLQGAILKREIKGILQVGTGGSATAGTAGGGIQSATDSAGSGVATVLTFDTQPATGGSDVQHAVPTAGHRWFRGLGSVQASKYMSVGIVMIAEARVRP